VLLPEHVITDGIAVEATFYGIGVLARKQDRVRVVVDPAPFAVRRWSWALWQFYEQAYLATVKRAANARPLMTLTPVAPG
jgi:hypothetical protein